MMKYLELPLERRIFAWDPSRLPDMERALARFNWPGWFDRWRLRFAQHIANISSSYREADDVDWGLSRLYALGSRAYFRSMRFVAGLVAPPSKPLAIAFIKWLPSVIDRSGTVSIQLREDGRLYVRGEPVDAPEVVREWRLFRYRLTRIPVSLDGETCPYYDTKMTVRDSPLLHVRYSNRGFVEELLISAQPTTGLGAADQESCPPDAGSQANEAGKGSTNECPCRTD